MQVRRARPRFSSLKGASPVHQLKPSDLSHIRAERIGLSYWVSKAGWVLGYGMFDRTELSFFTRAAHELLSVEFKASWKNP
jgi:hypothetical protein